ncbi:MAG TPA: HupE/UreJ family protein [Usitatibacter sp.]|nr:HupE/UreJ family protein [Usitatibacter sp.]
MIDRRAPRAILVGLALWGCAMPALAHVGHSGAAGAWTGFSHPFSGLDHVLAMVAVGAWAAQLGRRALVILPLAFPAMMALGGLAGFAGVPLAYAEPGIALSVLLLGLLVAIEARARVGLAAALVGVFAVFHGHVHAVEMPAGGGAIAYAAGFLLATVSLHAVGMAIGLLPRRSHVFVRAAGLAAAGAGVALLATAG